MDDNRTEEPMLPFITEDSETEKYLLHMDFFEGPLDLLLHLIRKEEINIYDIPIARITEQYLKYVRLMENLKINLAGEFLVMAANLIYLKSRMLLPPDPVAEGEQPGEDPRLELVQQLLEHAKFKQAAQILYERETIELSSFVNPKDEAASEEGALISATTFDLISTFFKIVERFKERIVLEVKGEEVSLEGRLADIRKRLGLQGSFYFSNFFEEKFTKLYLVVTLFALLELVRLQEIRLMQSAHYEDIKIVKVA